MGHLKCSQKDKTAVSVSQSLVVSEDGEASVKIPPFYFPLGRPAISAAEVEPDQTLKLAREYLKKSAADEKIQRADMHGFAKVRLGLMVQAAELFQPGTVSIIDHIEIRKLIVF